MLSRSALLAEMGELIAAHARPEMTTPIDGLLVSRVASDLPDYSLTEPLLVVMAQGRKRLLLGDRTVEYSAGQCLVVAAELPVTGRFLGASSAEPALGMAITLRPPVIASLLLEAPAAPHRQDLTPSPAIATGDVAPALLDAVVRMVRLLDNPADVPMLAPLVEKEILWRLLTGPHGAVVRQIGLSDSGLTHVTRAIAWIREHYAEPIRVADLARLVGMSVSAFHRRFRSVTTMSPLQFQKLIRLQEARALLVATSGDVAGVGHLVGYDSPTQFSREYRRMFGDPPGRHSVILRAEAATPAQRQLP
ncbi:AraC family transcriptional regulator [Mycolicibacterium sp. 3033]|nr:AraC family transcriptional regulator [Mycolicibacterium aurantiacum]